MIMYLKPWLSVLLLSAVFAGTFKHPNPPKPGFYKVEIKGGEWKFKELPPVEKDLQKVRTPSVNSWNFSKVANSKAISTVKDQGQCGGCWAFASSDVAGAAYFLHSHIDKDFSPQYLVNCRAEEKYLNGTYEQDGCNGGYPIIAFIDILKHGHVEEKCVPWKGDPGNRSTCGDTKKCNGSDNTVGSNKTEFDDPIYEYVDAYHVSLTQLKELVTTSGPCVAEMNVYDDLSAYKAGDPVYSHKVEHVPEGHAVTVYGFGVQDGVDYWLIKNSWGKTWGDKGFFRIKMGSNESDIEKNFFSLVDRRGQSNINCNGNDACNTHGDGPTETGSQCSDITVSGDCNGNSSCKWYTGAEIPPNLPEIDPFCDQRNPQCSSFDGANCPLSAYRLIACKADKGKCVDPSAAVTVPCSDLKTVGACQNGPNCKWYDSSSDSFCDDDDISCESFGTEDYCKSSFQWGLGCYWDGPANATDNRYQDCDGLSASACRDEPLCSAEQGRECKWTGKCIDAPSCEQYVTQELCLNERGCKWEEGAGGFINSFVDLIPSTGSCVPSRGWRLALSGPLLFLAVLLLAFMA